MRQGVGMTSPWEAAILVPLANRHILMILLHYAKNQNITHSNNTPPPILLFGCDFLKLFIEIIDDYCQQVVRPKKWLKT